MQKNGTLALAYNEDTNLRYISDGIGIYHMPEFGENLSAEDICNMYDISESKQDKMLFTEIQLDDFLIKDRYTNETEAVPTDLRVVIDDTILQPFKTEIGCVLINKSYIDIIGIDMLKLKFYLRDNKFLAIKSGLILEGVVGIYFRYSEKSLKDMTTLSTLVSMYFDNIKTSEEKSEKQN